MDHALPVCVVNRLANRSEEVDNLRRRWNLPFMGCLMKIVRQRLAFDVLHHHVGQGCVGTAFRLLWLHHMEIVDLHDIGMMQRSDKLGFALKARDEIRIIAQVRSEERRVGKECRSRCDWSSDVCSSDLSHGNRGSARYWDDAAKR